ncbi:MULTISPECIES: hypothetical protein [unclassified Rothia (in: high G+C Gram-positive bacteria)]|uniref:hypothetical protein n=1 Tax=unclassified Rothia (in: high G+C Gram-positive bacteria) TaxID=2689056 RepID=UPI00195C3C6A|nr:MULTISPECIES: hypothetical protein [unclassified Rothia (in: high G+C Gram-positive bacteria)]MBM7052117.1 hypothetical protein [Rothia sp. ZJ1223]QRZ61450.1 hypothetical protein JR346_09545 [Rothia sp. ZJ932]
MFSFATGALEWTLARRTFTVEDDRVEITADPHTDLWVAHLFLFPRWHRPSDTDENP